VILSVIASFFALAEANADPAFQQKVDQLRKNQAGIDQLIRNMGRSSGFSSEPNAVPQSPSEPPASLFRVHDSLGSVRIPAGRLLFGRTVNRLVVGVEGSPVLIDLDEGQGALSGIRVTGLARQSGTEGRVTVEIQRVLLRSGKAISIQGAGLDPEGAYGLSAQVMSSKALAVAGAMASSFISGLAAAQQTQTTSPFGFSQVQPTGRNAILQGVAQTAADQSKRLIEDATKEKPVLIVEALSPVTVMIQEEVRW